MFHPHFRLDGEKLKLQSAGFQRRGWADWGVGVSNEDRLWNLLSGGGSPDSRAKGTGSLGVTGGDGDAKERMAPGVSGWSKDQGGAAG